MKILITGGCGFMGSDFVRETVKKGFEVVVVDKLTYAGDERRISEVLEKVKLYKTDIVNYENVKEIIVEEKPDIIVHYAAETHVDRSILSPNEFIYTNVVGTFNLLQACKEFLKDFLFVHISTDEVYGDLPKDKNLKFKETDPLRPKSPYSASKASADHLVNAFFKTYKFPAIIVRASNNYGPWQYPEKLIPLTIARILSGRKVPLYGDGKQVRTWLFVEDFTDAIFKVIKNGNVGEVYNIGSNEEKENIEVVKKILKLLGKNNEDLIEFTPDRPGHDLRYALDTEKAYKELGWEAKTSFEEGLRKTVEWYLKNKEWLFEKLGEAEEFKEKMFRYYSQFSKEEE